MEYIEKFSLADGVNSLMLSDRASDKFFSAWVQSLKPKMFFHSFIHLKKKASARRVRYVRFSDTRARRFPLPDSPGQVKPLVGQLKVT